MRIINTRWDVEDLHRDSSTPAVLTKHIAGFFRQLEAELADDEGSFSLDQHGPIV